VFSLPTRDRPMTSENSPVGPIDPDVWENATDPASVVLEGEVIRVYDDTDFASIRGRTAPRIWTRPLRPLTRDATQGYEFAEWCDERAYTLDRWEFWLAIHALELLPDGRPRFRRVVVIVARQNGKSLFVKLLILWWAYVDSRRMILMTSQNLGYARLAWMEVAEMTGAEVSLPVGVRPLEGITAAAIRQANGQEQLTAPAYWPGVPWKRTEVRGGGTFKIAATKGDGAGRSMTLHRLVMDEVREHRTWDAYNAGKHAQNAVTDAQAFFISNMGGAEAVVLTALRTSALTGKDRRLGIFEWSCLPGSRPDDLDALRWANPNLGLHPWGRIDPEGLLGDAITAMDEGGEALTKFKTEVMCIEVPRMNPAVDPEAWLECSGDVAMDELRNRVAACLDVSPDGRHATLVAAAVAPDGRVRVEVVEHWENTHALRRGLARAVAKIKPRTFSWFPKGPAARLHTELTARPNKARRSVTWPPPGVRVEEIQAETPAVCMGFADLVDNRQLVHADDELLTTHVSAAEKLYQGPVWVFARRLNEDGVELDSGSPVDAAYAAAGAVHQARLLPAAPRRTRLVVAK
jgi:hypothetical protein